MMRRVAVIGTSGSGKTTFARALSHRLGLAGVEADALYWGPDWTPRADFRQQIESAVDKSEWIIDGNYSKVRDLIWPRADAIIWLDYSLARILLQLLRRTAWRSVSREKLWAGNRERPLIQLFSRESVFRWGVSSFFRHRREYPQLLMIAARRGTHVVRFRSPRQTREWLSALEMSEAI